MYGGHDCKNNVIYLEECLKKNDHLSIINLLNKVHTDNVHSTKNKYFVILYGPSASGKTFVRNVAIDKIMEYEKDNKDNNNNNNDNICKTFIDTGLDDLTYKMCYNNDDINNVQETVQKTVQDELIRITKEICGENENLSTCKIDNEEKIKEVINKTSPIYLSNRASALSDLLVAYAVALDKNIFFEISIANKDYIINTIDRLGYYGYISVIIYPFVDNVNDLYTRNINRGYKEGRWLSCDGPFGLNKNMKSMFVDYDDLKII